jgi:hypothetical protein
LTRLIDVIDDSTPWATGLTVAAFVAAVTAAAVVVLSLWGWRKLPVWRWFVLGSGVGVAGAWLALLAMALVEFTR